MTETGDAANLDELEPIQESAAEAPAAAGAMEAAVLQMRSGLPTPFYNRAASPAYYRMLFGGVLMFVGCMMPFGPEWEMAGYKTMTGGLSFILALGLLWASWGAIHTGRPPSIKWFVLPFFSVIMMLLHVANPWGQPAVVDGLSRGVAMVTDWGNFFETLVDRADPDRYSKVGNFFRYAGIGQFFVLVGALVAFLTFVKGLFGGAAVNKQKKLAAQAAASERRRR